MHVMETQLCSNFSSSALPCLARDSVWAMKIREDYENCLCCIVYDTCAQWYAHTYEQFLESTVGEGLHPATVCWVMSTSLRFEAGVEKPTDLHPVAFSALTLLVGRQEEHLACKKWVTRCWHGYMSEARCKWFACGQADATAISRSLASLKSRLV